MTVVSADGQDVEPVAVDEFRISVAETYGVIVEPDDECAYTVFAQSIDRSGHARGTLAPRAGMQAEVPVMDPRTRLGMQDMMGALAGAGHGGMHEISDAVTDVDMHHATWLRWRAWATCRCAMQQWGMLLLDHLEATHANDSNGQASAVEGGYGGDDDKLWLRGEGERRRGRVDDADLEVFWNHSVAAVWNTQLGVRQDIGEGLDRSWAAFGVQGLAPYGFDIEATAYLDPFGRVASRLCVEYEMRFTQRLILQPEAEINFTGEDGPERRVGSGLSDVQFGLRLRYEMRRQFAPYLGMEWIRRLGASADFAGAGGLPARERQIAVEVHIWL